MAYLTDSQQKPLYAWEGTWPDWNRQQLDREKTWKLVKQVCQLYRVPLPRLVVLRRGKKGLRQGWRTAYDPNDHSLTLAPQHQNRAVVLHETAHLVHSVILGDEDHEIHGPEFLAIYLYLLRRFGAAPALALYATAKAGGLSWKSPDKHNPLRIRRTYRRLRKRNELET